MIANKAYIYGLIDPNTKEIRYVGKTINPSNRAQQHLKFRKYYAHTYKARWVDSLRRIGLQPKFVILEEVDLADAILREQYWIDYYRSIIGKRLTNSASGGQGPRNPIIGRSLSEETRRKISLANLGRKCSTETRRKRSLSMMGKNRGPKSEETKEKLRKANLGKPGHSCTTETKRYLSEITRLAWKSPEYREKHLLGMRIKNTERTLE